MLLPRCRERTLTRSSGEAMVSPQPLALNARRHPLLVPYLGEGAAPAPPPQACGHELRCYLGQISRRGL